MPRLNPRNISVRDDEQDEKIRFRPAKAEPQEKNTSETDVL